MERTIGVYNWELESVPREVGYQTVDLDFAINNLETVSRHSDYLRFMSDHAGGLVPGTYLGLGYFLNLQSHLPNFPTAELSEALKKEKERHPKEYLGFFPFVERCYGSEIVNAMHAIVENGDDISEDDKMIVKQFARDLPYMSKYVPAKGIVAVVNRLGKEDLNVQRYHLRFAFDGQHPNYMKLLGVYLQELRQEHGADLKDLILDHSEGHGTIGLIRNRLTHDVLVHDTPVDLLFEPEQKKIHIPGTKNEETRDWARKIVGGEGGSSYGHRSEVAGALIEKYLRINGPKEWRVVYPDEQTQIITN